MTEEEKALREKVSAALKGIIAAQLDIPEGEIEEKILPNTDPINELGADSLDLVEIIMETEEALKFEFEDDELEIIRTFEDFLNCVMKKLQQ